MRFAGIIVALAALGAAALAAAQTVPAPPDQQRRLAEARAQSAAAAGRSAQLDRAAAAERDAARKAQAEEAAAAARVQQAEADMAAARARIAIVGRLIAEQRARLAERQQPMAHLLAGLQSMARRPAIVSVIQPGSVDDLVHLRAVLGAVTPAIAARTAAIRSELARARRLRQDAALAAASLAEARQRNEAQRLALAQLEAQHRLRGEALGRTALVESDRAIALGEQARDLVDLMGQLGNAAQIGQSLVSLPAPLPRPDRPGDAPRPSDTPSWTAADPPYRLPVVGRLVTGVGEISDAGVRSRGLTFAVAPGAEVVAPARGRVVFAGPFRDYGRIVILDHGNGWATLIAGLDTLSARIGDRLEQGAPLGRAGAGDEPHVTVELRRRGRPVDPLPLAG